MGTAGITSNGGRFWGIPDPHIHLRPMVCPPSPRRPIGSSLVMIAEFCILLLGHTWAVHPRWIFLNSMGKITKCGWTIVNYILRFMGCLS